MGQRGRCGHTVWGAVEGRPRLRVNQPSVGTTLLWWGTKTSQCAEPRHGETAAQNCRHNPHARVRSANRAAVCGTDIELEQLIDCRAILPNLSCFIQACLRKDAVHDAVRQRVVAVPQQVVARDAEVVVCGGNTGNQGEARGEMGTVGQTRQAGRRERCGSRGLRLEHRLQAGWSTAKLANQAWEAITTEC